MSAEDTDLNLACRHGLVEQAKEAIGEGANVNCFGKEPLYWAFASANEAILRLLLENGADPSDYLPDGPREIDEAVASLLEIRARNTASEKSPGNAAEIDPVASCEIENLIRKEGMEDLLLARNAEELETHRDTLELIGADEKLEAFGDFLTWSAENPQPSTDALEDLRRIANRYLAANENVRSLVRAFNKELKASDKTVKD